MDLDGEKSKGGVRIYIYGGVLGKRVLHLPDETLRAIIDEMQREG